VPHRITTILGPCVAVALWDPLCGVGGMNHVALPHALGRDPIFSKLAGPGTRLLIDRVIARGAHRATLEARLFGGAHIAAGTGGHPTDIGSRNVEVARETLQSEGLPIVGEDVCGSRGRKVVFCTGTGAFRVTLL
jgi:chemotaxis protein CheD